MSPLRLDRPFVLIWELLLSLASLAMFTVILVNRELIYSKGKWGLMDDHNGSLVAITLVLLIVLLLTKPWIRLSIVGSFLRGLGIIAAVLGLVLTVLSSTPWGRYRIARLETTTLNLGLSSFETSLRRDLSLELVDSQLGPYLAQDKEVLLTLSRDSAEHFITSPRSAWASLCSLRNLGVEIEELLTRESEQKFLLACLAAEVNPKPDYGLDWLKPPPRSEQALAKASLFSSAQARAVVASFTPHLKRQERPSLEALVVVAMNFPQLFEPAEMDELLDVWSTSFYDLQDLAVEGLVNRELVREFLGANAPGKKLKVFIESEGSAPSEHYYKLTPEVLREMTLGLIRTCGYQAVPVENKQDADLRLIVSLGQDYVYSFMKPLYDYETYYEYRRSGGKWNSFGSKLKRERRVLKGHDEKDVFAPTATVSLQIGAEKLSLESGLVYWHSRTYDQEKSNYQEFRSADAWKRTWPLGVKSRYFEFEHLNNP